MKIKMYRILGKRGRITIPYEIRQRIGFTSNDVLSFEEQDDRTLLVRREKICNNCKAVRQSGADDKELFSFLNNLPTEQQRAALVHLSIKWAEKQGGVSYAG